MAQAPVHLRLENVSKHFGSVRAVDDVSLEVRQGSFTTLLGPSGCGKTTLLRIIAGFYDPDGGRIWLRDALLNGVPPFHRPTCMVFQDYALFPHMTVFENVAFGLVTRKEPRRTIREKVERVLAMVGLSGLEARRPNQLSGGQQQRVALARSLVVEPEVLLLDEPLSNLDAKMREHVRTELRALQQAIGITTIYVTHDQEEALALSDWVAVMSEGRLVQYGPPTEIYYHPADRFAADFLGTANFLRGKVTAIVPEGYAMDTEVGPLTVGEAGTGVRPGEEAVVIARPEAIGISPAAGGARAATNRVRGQIRQRSFLGKSVRYWVEVGGVTLVVEQSNPGPAGVLAGEVELAIDPSRLSLLRPGLAGPAVQAVEAGQAAVPQAEPRRAG